MCTTDHTLTLTRADGAVPVTVAITRPPQAPAPGEVGAYRDGLTWQASSLYDVLVSSLPATTLRALTSLMVAGLAASLETRPAAALPGKGAGWALVADGDGPRIDTIGIDEVLAPGDAGDIRPAGKDMETSIGVLIDEYKARASTARKAPSGTGDASYLTGVTEGLRIARRAVIRPAVAGRTP
jgi:hypothetical protein